MSEKYTKLEAYQQSVKMLKSCITPKGFLASASKKANYGRIWSRDGVICSLAALMTGDKQLIKCAKATLKTLSKKQHDLGFIPSNVDFVENKVSYGQTAGRVDASIWYIIGMGQYLKRTKDFGFILAHIKNIRKTVRLLRYWEFNDRHLLYVPTGGDWADEYINEGYVLYDQLLYLQANKEYAYIKKKIKMNGKKYRDKSHTLKDLIQVNYWLEAKNLYNKNVYNKNIFQKGLNDNLHKKPYLLPFFNPGGYGDKFDGLANTLAISFDAIPKLKQRQIINYIDDKFNKRTKGLIPSFWTPIKKGDEKWKELKNNYSAEFRNYPYQYHNGGLWQFINGFYAASIAHTKKKSAKRVLDAINWANHKSDTKTPWGFFEFIDSKKFKPGGMKYQAWSAAAGIMAYEAIINKKGIFL